jgi:methionine-rich copper-binding protein CopC
MELQQSNNKQANTKKKKKQQQKQNKQGIQNADPLEAGKYILTCMFAEVVLQHI